MERLRALTFVLAFGSAAASGVQVAQAQGPASLEVATFSTSQPGPGLPEGWKSLTFKKVPKQTRYQLVREGETMVVKATSEASASGLIKLVRIDPKEYPIIRWRP
ncbi:MAG: DUF3047 domain-containing protein [Burkholderiales bacterium]|nr:DUF3047 domain-containing protein [Burkholderiales bacterium]